MEGDPLNFRPPVLVGERVAWLGSGSGLPEGATVRWIGRVPEITNGWTVGIELDRAMPVGGIDGTWRKRKLFLCQPKHGLLVPIDKIVKESSLLKTRHSVGESFYSEGGKPLSERNQALLRQLSLPQTQTSQEFLSRVLPQVERNKKASVDEIAALSFKVAASQIHSPKVNGQINFGRNHNDQGHSSVSLERGILSPSNESNLSTSKQKGLFKTSSLDKSRIAPLSVENVKSLEESRSLKNDVTRSKQDWAATCEEWERFKKYLDTVGNVKKIEHSPQSRNRLKVGQNPNSLYAHAKPAEELETSLALRLIGERKEHDDRKRRSSVRKPELVIEEVSHENSFEKNETQIEYKESNSVLLENKSGRDIVPRIKDNLIESIPPKETGTPSTESHGYRSDHYNHNSEGSNGHREELKKKPNVNLSQDQLSEQVKTTHVNDIVVTVANSHGAEADCGARQKVKTDINTFVKEGNSSNSSGRVVSVVNLNTEASNLEEEHCNIERPVNVSNNLSIDPNTLNEKVNQQRKKVDLAVQTPPLRTKKPITRDLPLKTAQSSDLPVPEFLVTSSFNTVKPEELQAIESEEVDYCEDTVAVTDVEVLISEDLLPEAEVIAVEEADASESVPAPTLRRKRQPVPTPRRKQKEDRREDDESFDTTSVLYEPAFLRAYCNGEPSQNTMTDIQGTFRRIDEDEIDRPKQHRVLSGSVSAPDTNRKGLFSFLRWFKRNKTVEDLDLDLNALNSASVTSSPVFSRNSRITSAESVDTLYSIATASSFAFVSASQYQRERNGTIERKKKRRAPQPPVRGEASLPNTLEFRGRVSHRRTASESNKDRRLFHVQGKRKAPPPPVPPPRIYPTLSTVRDPYPSFTKKKRPAPLPPERTPNETGARVLANNLEGAISGESNPSTSHVMVVPASEETVVCNDTLKLERGVLKPNKMPSVTPDVAKVIPLSPVSPRPWYKRKSLEKKKEKVSDDWMPEVGYSRPGFSPDVNPLKLFFSRGDDKKKDEKRKSGISMLANISELDREAAEICRREQENKQQRLAADDAKFYDAPLDVLPPFQVLDDESSQKRNSTRELISLFNSIGSVTKVSSSSPFFVRQNGIVPQRRAEFDHQNDLTVGVPTKPDIKTASVADTKNFLSEEPIPRSLKSEVTEDSDFKNASKAQALFDLRNRRSRSPSPTISTIAEMSEPSSSAGTTLNQYAEPVWKCSRCTLENGHWRNRCDACNSCKPNYNPAKKRIPFSVSDKRKSEMDFEIDWEQQLRKYFPTKTEVGEDEVSSKLTLSKTGDIEIKTEASQGKEDTDIDEIRKRRMAFFMKTLGTEVTSVRDAAAKKSLDEAEKLKLKGMLKEMKESLPKREAVINNAASNLNVGGDSKPDVTTYKNDVPTATSKQNGVIDEGKKYGAIKKVKKEEPEKAEALLVTTTTVFEDIIVRKKKVEKDQQTSPVVEYPVQNFTTLGLKNGEQYTSLKKARRIGDGPFELMRARDLATIIESKTGTAFPATHVYANVPAVRQSESSDSSILEEDNLTTAAGLAKFKASLDPSASDTIAINRLLRKLEGAIADGRYDQAATLARELAVLKVPCSVIRQRPSPSPSPTAITVEMYVEDKLSHQGPIPLQLQRTLTLTQLKAKIQTDFQIPHHVQRWILGKQLATEDDKTLEELGVNEDRCPIFLYLVAPEPEAEPDEPHPPVPRERSPNENLEGAVGETHAPDKEPPKGKGWYYNYEEDRYSYCESEPEQSPEKEIPDLPTKAAAKRIIQRTIEAVQDSMKPVTPPSEKRVIEKEGAMVLQPVAQAKPYQPRAQRPPLLSSHSLPEGDLLRKSDIDVGKPIKEVKQNGAAEGQTGPSGETKITKVNEEGIEKSESQNVKLMDSPTPARPRSRSIFDLMKPQSNDTLKKDLKMISVNVKETIEMLSRRSEDITRQGWKCAVCTLINPATRPGCAACTSPRPPGYAQPPPRPAEDELRRLRRDQAMDLKLKEPEPLSSGSQTYMQLVNLDSADVVTNTEEFECAVCLMLQAVGEGVVLRECLHNFCRVCLAQTIQYNEEAEVKCPYRDDNYTCNSVLQEREIKALVPREVWEQHLARSVSQAENRIGNTFHCKTPDCRGWCIVEDNVNEYRCPVCRHTNCLTCQTIHEGMNCREYQERLKSNSETDADAKRTRSMLEEMVQRGDAMACPTCQVVLMKKWGCDWLRCSMCKTEICWVTRGPRWGPAGKGDTSSGCQCGLNGVKCHPKCNYCH